MHMVLTAGGSGLDQKLKNTTTLQDMLLIK